MTLQYLTITETAERFATSTKTIRRLVKEQRIPYTRAIGALRFPADALEDWARAPEATLARWFSGKLEAERKADDGNEERENLGRALFLQGQGRQ